MPAIRRKTNELRYGSSGSGSSLVQESWLNADARIPEIYLANAAASMTMDEALSERYFASTGDQGSKLASAYLVLKSGFSPFVTTFLGSYDAHTSHLSPHKAQLRNFGDALTVFVDDLRNTPDPDDPSLSLAETTLILVFSEFVRTPTFNSHGGTDHWQSASAIVMGPGVRDNHVIGATDATAQALGWDGAKAVARSSDTKIGPENLASALVTQLGFEDLGLGLGEPLNGLFT